MKRMEHHKIKTFILIFAVIAIFLFLGLASEGKIGIALFNNTSHTTETPEAGEPIAYLISNLTRPAEVEISEEDIKRIPKVEGVVNSNGNGNSSEYEETVLGSFLQAAEQFSGAGKGMETYKVDTFDLLTDPDFAEPAYLGREKGVKVSIVYNSSPSNIDETYWGHLTDASLITHSIYGSTAGSDTGYVTVSYMFAEKAPRFQVTLTAQDAGTISSDWTEDNYLPMSAWSTVTIDSSEGIVPYENIDTALPETQRNEGMFSDAATPVSAVTEYNLYLSKNDLKELFGRYSIEIQNYIQKISDDSINSDFRSMADTSNNMMIRAAEIEDEIKQLPISPEYTDVAKNFLEGMRNYRYAGSYFWYGSLFTEIEPIKTGNTYIQQGFSKNNDALEALDIETIETELFEMPSTDVFPNAKYIYENFEYQDTYKRNDISAKLSSFSSTDTYVLKQGDNVERNVAGYGYKYIFPVVEFHHLGYRGTGSSRITTPDTDDFSIFYNGEEYTSITPSPYVGRTLDTTTYIEPIGYPYYKMNLNRKEAYEGVLVFKVPHDFDPAKAYMVLDLGDEEAVWHMLPR
ncbi:hypothetical protein L0665_03005 [Methanogenium marinum]|uniref:Uncharacterized protein n=1 Tax=Methanogenium marinum TaxID=348610 RepID=A0A9Q4KTA5_9EURY|nr:hypothetical protein [Methanogenium marinum]MDE4907582.1 hypothetical protein [Methanogenium marinum]